MNDTPAAIPDPLPYQRRLVRHLREEESELWEWFVSSSRRAEQAEAVRLDLLKSTYRLERGAHPELYATAEQVLAGYGVTAPVTFYQTQGPGGLNAALAYLPGEAHIVLAGPVLSALGEVERKAVLAHELAHFLLFDGWNGDFFVAAELLRALSSDQTAAPPHLESARLFTLYAEVFADRAAYFVTRDADATIATLLKMTTGLTEVSAASYLRQAEEIFSKGRVQADQLTHPEPYIRARALHLWAERGDDALPEIERMIQGPLALDRLDVLAQQRVAATTRLLLRGLLASPWFQTEPVLAHAHLFFDDFRIDSEAVDLETLAAEVKESDTALRDYYCYVLLDFVAVDRDLSDAALAAAIVLGRRLELGARFGEIAVKELGLSKRQFSKIDKDADAIVARAGEVTTQA